MISEKENSFLNTWQKYRERGKTIYMAGYAMIYALVVGIVSLVSRVDNTPVRELLFSWEFLTKLILFMAIGLILAHFKWKAKNKRFDEIKSLTNQNH
jgi:predicted membrane channel-forming protein YqfA (hemolysin III family)